MAEPITRVTLFVPGTPPSAKQWSAALRRGGGARLERGALHADGLDAPVDAEWIANDGAFGQAQQLERSRGYADLDPALAWEQWKLVRCPPPPLMKLVSDPALKT